MPQAPADPKTGTENLRCSIRDAMDVDVPKKLTDGSKLSHSVESSGKYMAQDGSVHSPSLKLALAETTTSSSFFSKDDMVDSAEILD